MKLKIGYCGVTGYCSKMIQDKGSGLGFGFKISVKGRFEYTNWGRGRNGQWVLKMYLEGSLVT